MRRLTSHFGITLLALLLCGWGEAMASVLCPHAAGLDHACRPEKTESAPAEKHHSGSHHRPARGAESELREHSSHHRVAEAAGPAAGSSCAHCMGQKDLPAAPAGVRELTALNSGAGKAAAHATKILAQPAAAAPVSRFAPTQHAPHGPAGRTHLLLLSVFLI